MSNRTWTFSDIFGHFQDFLPWFNQTIITITVNIQSKVTEFKCIIHILRLILCWESKIFNHAFIKRGLRQDVRVPTLHPYVIMSATITTAAVSRAGFSAVFYDAIGPCSVGSKEQGGLDVACTTFLHCVLQWTFITIILL